jgi:hypothetical protein
MSCTGYDNKAVKLSKAVKRVASTIVDNHQRGAFIRSYVQVLLEDSKQNKSRKNK